MSGLRRLVVFLVFAFNVREKMFSPLLNRTGREAVIS